jgi:hypothetical protein
MATSNRRYLNWLRYSGATLTVKINPMHWNLIPQWQREIYNDWAGPNERTWSASWLCLTLRFWIDDGSW